MVGGVEADYVTNRLKENGDEEKKERVATEKERGREKRTIIRRHRARYLAPVQRIVGVASISSK